MIHDLQLVFTVNSMFGCALAPVVLHPRQNGIVNLQRVYLQIWLILCKHPSSQHFWIYCLVCKITHSILSEVESPVRQFFFAMGINCLLPFVKNQLKSVNIKDFEGKIIAVDASFWLHKALSVSMRRTGSFSRWGTKVLCLNSSSSYFVLSVVHFQWR